MGLMRGIRKNIKGIYWVVVVMIVVTFLFWGTVARPGRGPVHAGMVFGKKISMKDFRLQWLAAREQAIRYELRTGQLISPRQIEAIAWQRVIRLLEGDKWRITVPMGQVREQVRKQFSRDERFDEDAYRAYLESKRLSEDDLAAMIRDDLRIAQLERFVSGAVVVSPQELREKYNYDNEQRKIKFYMVEADSLLPAFDVSGEGERYYLAHKDEFREPEKAAVQYILVEKKPFLEKVSLTEEELRSYYETNKSSYKGADGKTAEFDEVKLQIERILKSRKAEEMARKEAEEIFDFSDASRMKEVAEKNGLSLRQTELIPETGPVSDELAKQPQFRKAAFDIPMGEVSPIIETKGGYAVLSPIRVVPSRLASFEEVRKKAAEKQRAERLGEVARHAGILPGELATFIKEHSIIPADIDVSDEEAQRYYESPSHKSDFREPKKAKVQYLLVEKEPFEEEVKISKRDIRAEYRDNEWKYKDENGKVKPLTDVTEEIEKDLRAKKADEMAKERANEIFAIYRPQRMKQQAVKYDLELRESHLFARGEKIDDYMGESATFAYHALQTKVGEVSAIFPTDKGYCVLSPVQVVDETGADFEDVAEDAAQKAKKGKADALASKIAYELYRQARQKKDFETACKELGLQVEESGYFRRDDYKIEKVGATQRQTRSIFQTEQGKIGSPRKVPRGAFLYVVSEVKPPSDEEFAEGRDEYYTKLTREKSLQAFQEWSVALLREALEGASPNVINALSPSPKKATEQEKRPAARRPGMQRRPGGP